MVVGYSGDHVTAGPQPQQNQPGVFRRGWKKPGLNGRQVYEQVRATDPKLCRRMVFVTGDAVNDQTREFLETEKLLYLVKPFSLLELRSAMRTILQSLTVETVEN